MKKLFGFKQLMNLALAFLMVFLSIAWNGLSVKAATTTGENLIHNGGFEIAGTGENNDVFADWDETKNNKSDLVVTGEANVRSGNQALQAQGRNNYVTQPVKVTPGKTYELTGYVCLPGSINGRISITKYSDLEATGVSFGNKDFGHAKSIPKDLKFTDSDGKEVSEFIMEQGNWYKFSYTVTAPQDVNYLEVLLGGAGAGMPLYDDIALCEVVAATGLSINDGAESVSVEAGKTVELTATVTPDNATDKTVTWSSNKTDVATVNETTGVVTGGSEGIATITATVGENVTDTITVNVTPAYVAQIKDGEKYETLQEAIAVAESATEAVVITLLDDVVYEENLTIGNGITLDLNENELTVSSLATFKGNVVNGPQEKTGVLKVDSTKCAFSPENTQMPVYDIQKSGYVFADIEKQEAPSLEGDSIVFNLFFKPSFGTTINTLLASSGKNDAHVSVIIRLTWKGQSHDLIYNNEMVKAVYDNNNKAFYINASSVTKFEGLTITPMVISDDLGVIWSGTTFSDFTTTNP